MRLCKTEPPCESQSAELIFAQLFENVLALYMICGQRKDAQLAGPLKQIGACNFVFCVRWVLVIFLLKWILGIIFDAKKKEFPLVFNIFEKCS